MFYFPWKIPVGGLKPRRFQYPLTRSIIARNAWWTVHLVVMWIWLTPMKVRTEVHMDIGSPRMLTSKVMFLIFFKVFWLLSTCGAICFPLSPKGFASLQAKRRFRVPRINSKHPNPPNENSSTAEQVTEVAAACETDSSPSSLFDDFRYLGNATPPEGYVKF